MTLRLPNRFLRFPRRPLVMGIVNVNDDSFSGDGTLDLDRAADQAARQVEERADIVDVGVNTESSFATTAAQKIIPLWLHRARVPRPK